MPLSRTTAKRFVRQMEEGGSLPALIKADDGELYVVKLRGAAQGVSQLIAEIISGEVARRLGLDIPQISLVEITSDFPEEEQDGTTKRLLNWSVGLNVGLRFLPGSTMFDPAANDTVEEELASRILWFDSLVLNVDRTVRNPNLLQEGQRLWLIDHGASLYFHFSWETWRQKIHVDLRHLETHVLFPWATQMEEADEYAHRTLTEMDFEDVVGLVPDELFPQSGDSPLVAEQRQWYVRFLRERFCRSAEFGEAVNRVREGTL